MQWQPVAAAAAVTGLAFVLVQMLPRDRGVVPSPEVAAPAARTEQDVTALPPVDRTDHVAPAPAAAPTATMEQPAANSVARSEAVAGRAAGEAAADSRQRDATAADVSAGATPAAMSAPASAAKQDAAVSTSAEQWAARIATLYESGHTAQAADALREFRAAYGEADTYLAEPLREWAQTIE